MDPPLPAPEPPQLAPRLPPPGLEMLVERSAAKHDEFYKYWDRFLRVKESAKARIVAKRQQKVSGEKNFRDRKGSDSSSQGEARKGVSLETDVEGRPGHLLVRRNTAGVVSHQRSSTSYDEAAASCRAKVEAICRECRRRNQKYWDRMWPLPQADTLHSLNADEVPSALKPIVGVGGVKRVEDIFDEPAFFIDDATANDIRQGQSGDCWFLAAISALAGKPELIHKLCVARDEQVGVYGFVFFRDGEWISEVVDDMLCLRQSDDTKNFHTEHMIITNGDANPMNQSLVTMSYGITRLPTDFREGLRKGSNALFYASCKDSNETWLPLLEKAYAKAHGDYQAIEGGWPGEGIEDLTGGVATQIMSEDVLDKDRLWKELLEVNENFLFGCASRQGRDLDPADDEGFVRGHAYTVLEARELEKPQSVIDQEEQQALKAKTKYLSKKRNEKLRLLKIRNPWGRQEWNGAWSDGSREWTHEVMRELKHVFGDDGIFWISYTDFLRYYPIIDRVRLIGPEWTVVQQWTAVRVPYTTRYLDTSFSFHVEQGGPVVLVLCQPDERYFRGLSGRFTYDLHFRLYKDGEETYLLRSMDVGCSPRSCSAELDLEPGSYTILIKVTAYRSKSAATAEEVMKKFREVRREKLLAVGKSFDAVHAKGRLRDVEEDDAKADKAEQKLDHKQRLVGRREQKKKERERGRKQRRRREVERRRKQEEKVRLAKERRARERQSREKDLEKVTKATGQDESGSPDKETTSTADPVPQTANATPDSSLGLTRLIVDDATAKKPIPAPEPSTKERTENEKSPAGDQQAADIPPSEDSKREEAPRSRELKEEKGGRTRDEGDEDDSSIICSACSSVADEDFDWDDEIDGSGTERSLRGCSSGDSDSSDSSWEGHSDEESDDDMFRQDPWHARCVIGLRICSLEQTVTVAVKHGEHGVNDSIYGGERN